MYPRNLTWIELKEYIDNDRGPLVISIGSLEGHGAHLPIDTDALIASYVADELAMKRTKVRFGALQAEELLHIVNIY